MTRHFGFLRQIQSILMVITRIVITSMVITCMAITWLLLGLLLLSWLLLAWLLLVWLLLVYSAIKNLYCSIIYYIYFIVYSLSYCSSIRNVYWH